VVRKLYFSKHITAFFINRNCCYQKITAKGFYAVHVNGCSEKPTLTIIILLSPPSSISRVVVVVVSKWRAFMRVNVCVCVCVLARIRVQCRNFILFCFHGLWTICTIIIYNICTRHERAYIMTRETIRSESQKDYYCLVIINAKSSAARRAGKSGGGGGWFSRVPKYLYIIFVGFDSIALHTP